MTKTKNQQTKWRGHHIHRHPVYQDYGATLSGRVVSFKGRRPKFMKLGDNGNGYKQVNVSHKGRVVRYLVHRFVWECWIGPIPEGMQIDHTNERKSDNSLDNLDLVTPEENIARVHWNRLQRRLERGGGR